MFPSTLSRDSVNGVSQVVLIPSTETRNLKYWLSLRGKKKKGGLERGREVINSKGSSERWKRKLINATFIKFYWPVAV